MIRKISDKFEYQLNSTQLTLSHSLTHSLVMLEISLFYIMLTFAAVSSHPYDISICLVKDKTGICCICKWNFPFVSENAQIHFVWFNSTVTK